MLRNLPFLRALPGPVFEALLARGNLLKCERGEVRCLPLCSPRLEIFCIQQGICIQQGMHACMPAQLAKRHVPCSLFRCTAS